MPPFKDLSGQTFGYLYVIEPTPKRDGSNRIFKCRCTNCGRIIELPSRTIAHSGQISCGCIKNRNLATKPAAEKLGQTCGTNISRISSHTIQRNNTSGVRGVSQTKSGSYHAYIYFQHKRYCLYYGPNREKAMAARKEAEQRIFGGFLEWYNATYPKKQPDPSDQK